MSIAACTFTLCNGFNLNSASLHYMLEEIESILFLLIYFIYIFSYCDQNLKIGESFREYSQERSRDLVVHCLRKIELVYYNRELESLPFWRRKNKIRN